MTKTVLLRCDASARIGFGHLVRCLALADALAEGGAYTPEFLLREDPQAVKTIAERGYRQHYLSAEDEEGYHHEVLSVAKARKIVVFIGDVRDGLPPQTIAALKEWGVLTVAIDEPSTYRTEVDLAFYPPIPQVASMDWSGFAGKLYAGWNFVMLRPEFSSGLYPPYQDRIHRHVLVSCGASDPANLSVAIVKALLGLPELLPVKIVVGPAAANGNELERLVAKASHFEIIRGASTLAPLLSESLFAIISFGVTAYECASLAVPALHYSLSADHALSSGVFVRSNMALDLGLCADFEASKLTREVTSLLAQKQQLQVMAQACAPLSAQGRPTIASTISDELSKRAMTSRF
jgi:spore coat polysaccharide biosynthesis protein SpsF